MQKKKSLGLQGLEQKDVKWTKINVWRLFGLILMEYPILKEHVKPIFKGPILIWSLKKQCQKNCPDRNWINFYQAGSTT